METTTFLGLGVRADLAEALARDGIETPFPIQATTIPDALAGRDVCGRAKTGSGKTLAFGLPLLQRTEPGAAARSPRALVLAPTRELAAQVAEVLEPLATVAGLTVAVVYGGAPMRSQVRDMRDGADVVVATPGRLIDLIGQGEVRLDDVRTLVLDEADRMCDMGFTPQVDWILRHATGVDQTLLFSATLDGDVAHFVRRYMDNPVRHELDAGARSVGRLVHRFLKVHELDKPRVAAAISRGGTRTIMFCRTKRSADRLVRDLRKEGVHAVAIHGDLRQSQREQSLADFSTGRRSVLVATDVAARGLHIDDIDTVVHYDPADDHKAYLHRSGRTARAGAAGVAVTLFLYNEELLVRSLQRRLGVDEPLVEVFSNDPKLADLVDWGIAG